MRRTTILLIAGVLVLGMLAAPASASATSSRTDAADYDTPVLVVTVRAQGSSRFGQLYWEGAQPSVSFDVIRNGKRIKTTSGSTTGNNFYTDAVKRLRGTFTYKVCYSAAPTNCSNSITVVYNSSTETGVPYHRNGQMCSDT
jgi:hypothetical protein